jgi:hypothetical protein
LFFKKKKTLACDMLLLWFPGTGQGLKAAGHRHITSSTSASSSSYLARTTTPSHAFSLPSHHSVCFTKGERVEETLI